MNIGNIILQRDTMLMSVGAICRFHSLFTFYTLVRILVQSVFWRQATE